MDSRLDFVVVVLFFTRFGCVLFIVEWLMVVSFITVTMVLSAFFVSRLPAVDEVDCQMIHQNDARRLQNPIFWSTENAVWAPPNAM